MAVSADHQSPALTSEYFSIHLSVENKEGCGLKDLRVGVALSDPMIEDGQKTGTGMVLKVCYPHTYHSLSLSCSSPLSKSHSLSFLPFSSSAELYLAIPHTPTVQQNKQSLELMGGALGPGAKVRDKSHDQYANSHGSHVIAK